MATITELQDELALYKNARKKILTGAQSYRSGDFRADRADLPVIEKRINELESRIAMKANAGRINTAQVVFGGRRE